MRTLFIVGTIFLSLFGFGSVTVGDVGCIPGTPSAEGMNFEGEGTGVAGPFLLNEGTTLVNIESPANASSTITVNLMPAPGADFDSFDNLVLVDSDPISETQAVRVTIEGEYIIAVEADEREWTISVEQ